jgi:carboxypeptidase PM20D1
LGLEKEKYKKLEKIREIFQKLLVIPSMIGGATDARYFYEISDEVYRFYPLRMDSTSLTRFHGIDEKIGKENYKEIIEFSYQLIKAMQ